MLPPRINKNSKRADQGRRSPGHRAFVRRHACCACGSTVAVECAHVRVGTDGGMGIKPSDWWCVSLCKECHQEQHRGEVTFWKHAKMNPLELADAFYRASPHRHKLTAHPEARS